MSFERTRILLIEEESSCRVRLSGALHAAGYEVTAAGTGAEGLMLISDVGPEIVLVGTVLPDSSGLSVCTQLLDLGNIPVILLGETDDELEAVHGLDLGAADYIRNPARCREVLARVRAVLRRTSRHQVPDAGVTDLIPTETAARSVSASHV